MDLRGKWIFLVVAIVGTALDLATKALVFQKVTAPGQHVPVIEGFFYLSHVENRGGVFGLFAGFGQILALVRAAALFVIVYFLLRADARHRAAIWAYGFLFAGALGNLCDNVFNAGLVRDWIQFYLRPPLRGEFDSFNLADLWINVGVGLLLLHEFVFSRKKTAPVPENQL